MGQSATHLGGIFVRDIPDDSVAICWRDISYGQQYRADVYIVVTGKTPSDVSDPKKNLALDL